MTRTEYLDLLNLLKQVAATQQAIMDEQARQRTLIVQIQVEMRRIMSGSRAGQKHSIKQPKG